jgi:hypothetical protein
LAINTICKSPDRGSAARNARRAAAQLLRSAERVREARDVDVKVGRASRRVLGGVDTAQWRGIACSILLSTGHSIVQVFRAARSGKSAERAMRIRMLVPAWSDPQVVRVIFVLSMRCREMTGTSAKCSFAAAELRPRRVIRRNSIPSTWVLPGASRGVMLGIGNSNGMLHVIDAVTMRQRSEKRPVVFDRSCSSTLVSTLGPVGPWCAVPARGSHARSTSA